MKYNIYKVLQNQVSYDNGTTWENVGEPYKGDIYKEGVSSCIWDSPTVYEQYVIGGETYCNGKDKYIDILHQESIDKYNWSTAYITNAIVTRNSNECIDSPLVQRKDIDGDYFCTGNDKYIEKVHQHSYNGTDWNTVYTYDTLIERNSMDCNK